MIYCKMEYQEDMVKIEVKGHANYDKKGKDIVCAGVSALYYTLVQSIGRLTDCKFEETKDELIVIYPSEDAKLLINSFFIGMKEIELAYPKNVKVK